MGRVQTAMPSAQQDIMSGFQERVTEGLRTIETDHAYIHEGIAFKAYIEIASLSATTEFSFIVPAGTYVHLKNMRLQALGGSAKCAIMRGTTANPLVIDSAGSDPSANLTGPNNLRDGSPASGATILLTPTYVTNQAGEIWEFVKVLGDTTNQYTSVSDASMGLWEEVDLKDNTYYVFKISKVGVDDPTFVSLTLYWYEEGSR